MQFSLPPWLSPGPGTFLFTLHSGGLPVQGPVTWPLPALRGSHSRSGKNASSLTSRQALCFSVYHPSPLAQALLLFTVHRGARPRAFASHLAAGRTVRFTPREKTVLHRPPSFLPGEKTVLHRPPSFLQLSAPPTPPGLRWPVQVPLLVTWPLAASRTVQLPPRKKASSSGRRAAEFCTTQCTTYVPWPRHCSFSLYTPPHCAVPVQETGSSSGRRALCNTVYHPSPLGEALQGPLPVPSGCWRNCAVPA